MSAAWSDPMTPTARERGEVVTPRRGAHRAPRPDQTSWWAFLTFLLALFVAAHQLWSLM